MPNNQITSYDFFTSGKAIFTVFNDKGERYTYKIAKKPNKHYPALGFVYFVSLLTGPDNLNDYTYLGLFRPDSTDVIRTGKSKYARDSKPFKVIDWAVKCIRFRTPIPNGYGIIHEGRCCRCGRTLTTPESVEMGIGPECLKKAQVTC